MNYVGVKLLCWTLVGLCSHLLCFRTLCVLGGGICRPRVTGLERGACCFGCSNKVYRESAACTDPQSYDVSVHVYTYTKVETARALK